MPKTLITGGAGFIGSHLADKLVKEGHDVVVVDNLLTGKEENLNSAVKFYKTDVTSLDISEIFKKEKPTNVFHCAARINLRESIEDPIRDAETNIFGSLNVINSFIEGGAQDKRFVFISTGGAIYGDADIVPTPETFPENPLSPYGVAKLATEKYIGFFNRERGLSCISLRLANVYGPRQGAEGGAGVVAIFCKKLLNKESPVIYGDGNQTRDLVYVSDVVDACVSALKTEKTGVFNIATGKETSINEIFNLLKKHLKSGVQEEHISKKSGEQLRSCLDFGLAKEKLGWSPKVSIEEGTKKTAEWFSENKKNEKGI